MVVYPATRMSSLSEIPEELGYCSALKIPMAPLTGILTRFTGKPLATRPCSMPSKYTPRGGDTLFACTYSAYDSLDSLKKTLCDGLTAVHSPLGLMEYLSGQSHEGVRGNL